MFAKVYNTVTFMKPEAAVVEIEALLAKGTDEGDGEFDAPAAQLIEYKWPSVVDWECEYITSAMPGTVTLNGLCVVFP